MEEPGDVERASSGLGPLSLTRGGTLELIFPLGAVLGSDADLARFGGAAHAGAGELSSLDRALARHGLLAAPLRAVLRERVLSEVVSPCAEALLAQADARRALRTRADAASPVC